MLVVLAWQWRRDVTAGELALGPPLALAVDLLVVLAMSRLVRLELAALITRGLWVAAAGALGVVRPRASWGRPRVLTPRCVATVLAAFALAVLLSMYISRPYAIFDRVWHIPLVASLRAQRVPFVNVFDPTMGLHYHFSGDVLAAVAQTLSGNVLHSSLALSVTHDVVFGETAASLALLFVHLGVRGPASVAGTFAVLLSGPVTVLLGGAKRPWSGYSILSLFQIGYRPHAALAELLFVGIFAAILVRLHAPRGQLPALKTAPALLASTAALAITDEASTALLGLMIGAAWLLDADALHPKRPVGVALLAGLLAAAVFAQLLVAGSLAPGGQHHVISLVPMRSPGFYNPEFALTTPDGKWTLLADFLPVVAVLVAGVALCARSPRRDLRVSFGAFACLAAVSIWLVMRIDIDHAPLESHRFATAALFAAPLLGVVWAVAARERHGAARTLVVAVLGLASASTLEWIAAVAPVMAKTPADFHKPENLHDVDCHIVGSAFGDRAELTYIDPSIWHLYAGCRPVFAPAVRDGQNWQLQTKGPLQGQAAFAEIERLVGDKDMNVVCATGSDDAVCRKALAHAHCEPAGRRAMRCTLRPDERR